MVEETGSTNADLAMLVREGRAPGEGEWLVARRQTAGRGRQGRQWFDGLGNFMGSSLVLRLDGDPTPSSLSFVAALAVHDAAMQALGETANLALKWPNDVLLGGGKLSGILLEMVGHHIVVGIGVNIARAPDLPDRKTAALADHGAAPDVESFARSLADAFGARLAEWRAEGLSITLQRFLAQSIHAPGAPLRVHDGEGAPIEGRFAGLETSDGALRLRLADGSERVIRAGDVE
ncbi:biotin--[acetyl-CoA-carboxylase] ligase [Erythrobacter sp.]|uniref:biotin--[acetyl-CoA-carboxylase] ligase n=1 Tax=Erythrobacter sp. TaxID=1042 RepID=UPI001425E0F1|nr:biotin--[acetyl-CoA-carboxylase] ligase [Erythrobacter sp.]QIQ85997.1 MAG: biotin--[acetyl-CoA-carboxylase] ligase [Erythrobacter sp.]